MPGLSPYVCEGCGVLYDTLGPYWECLKSHCRHCALTPEARAAGAFWCGMEDECKAEATAAVAAGLASTDIPGG